MNKRRHVEVRDVITRDVPDRRFSAHWQPAIDDPQTFEETSFEDLDQAIQWARSRAPNVHISVADEPWDYRTYGIGNATEILESWPGSLPAEPDRLPGYSGTAYVRDDAHWETNGYYAIDRDGEAETERTDGRDLERLIDWGRERAPIVVVEVLPVSWSSPPPPEPRSYSAGDRDPAGENLPRLRPRAGEASMKWRVRFRDDAEFIVEAPNRREALHEAMSRYGQETLNFRGSTRFVLGSPEIEPAD